MIALQTAMACHYWLFSYYKLLPLLPFCHDLLGKHREQVGAAEVCGYEVFGGGEGGGGAQVQQAVLVLRKWLWLKEQSKGMWWYQDKNHPSVLCRLFCADITRCIFKHWLLSCARCNEHFMWNPWSGLFVFHTLVTPNFLWLYFIQRSLEGLSGSCSLLLAAPGLNMGGTKLLSHLLVTSGFMYGNPTSLDTPDGCLAAVCCTFPRYFTSSSPEPALTCCSAKSFCCLQLLPQLYSDCTCGSVWWGDAVIMYSCALAFC